MLHVVKDEREEDARPSWVAIEQLCGNSSALVRPGGGQLQMRTRYCDRTALPDPLVLSSGYMLQSFNLLLLPHRADFSVSCHRVICKGGGGWREAVTSLVPAAELLVQQVWLAGRPTFDMKLLFLGKLIVCSFLPILCKSGNLTLKITFLWK